jgi:hypothetical protein
MFQQMLRGSIAVLTRPSVATFEEHERNSLGWALIYASIGALASSLLGGLTFAITPQQGLDPATREQLAGTPFEAVFNAMFSPAGIVGVMAFGLLFSLIGFLIYLGLVYFIARGFGGTGQFGELAYDIALFYTPLVLANALVSVVSAVPFAACITVFVSLGLLGYNLYLTYLGIQAGMNVPKDKAIITMVIIAALGFVLACCLGVVLVAGMMTLISAAPMAP